MQLVLESLPFRAVFIMRLVLESMHGISRLCAGYERLGGTSRVAKSAIMSNEFFFMLPIASLNLLSIRPHDCFNHWAQPTAKSAKVASDIYHNHQQPQPC